MSLKMKILGVVALLCLCTTMLQAQVVANFTATPQEGCVGEVVQFTNTSITSGCSGTPTYSWDFENGQTSILENPAITFTESGSFDVSLTVSCDGESNTHIFTVEILPTPVASFENVSCSGCLNYTVQFVNTSTQDAGTIDNFSWVFGDGESSLDINPEHTYTIPGAFSVTLTATNENGCSDVYEQVDAIMTSDTPTVSFTALPQSYCLTPVDVFFDGSVFVSSGLGYTAAWDFGDGGTGTEIDMLHNYTSQGDYDVQLIVTDDYGCSRQIDSLDYIHLYPVTPEYTLYNYAFEEVSNEVLCMNQTSYFSCENEGYTVLWDFGGGMTSTSNVASIAFSTSGTHEVTMTIDPGGVCENQISINVEIEDPTPYFTMDPVNGFACNPPLNVDFTTTSGDVSEYHWLFGDGNDSPLENPVHVYSSYGTFTPVLEVTTENGCVGTYTGSEVTITKPNASFTADNVEGCMELNVNFTYDELTDPNEISVYNWDFGDGTSPFEGGMIENHAYEDTGEYVATLVVTDLNGCQDSLLVDIQVGDHHLPIFDSSIFPLNVCPWDSLNFISVSEDSLFIDDYEWLFGDTASWLWGTSTEHHQYDYTFDHDTGWVQVAHVVNHNGCRDTLYVPNLFYVNGPIVNSITVDHDCSAGNFYSMYVDLLEATEWDWIIQDTVGTTIATFLDVTDSTLVYDFPNDGEYWVHVIATNSDSVPSCEYEDSVKVIVVQPTALFGLLPSSTCAGVDYAFDGSNSINAVQYMWNFGDGIISEWSEDPLITHNYNIVGDVEVVLHVQDMNGCEDSTSHILHVIGPEITINTAIAAGCTPYTLNITGLVESDEPILLIEIEIGDWDTIIDVSSLNQNSVSFDVTHLMEDAGTFDLSVSARTGSCTIGNPIIIEDFLILTSIDAAFTSSVQRACLGSEIDFTPTITNTDYQYSWDFGDGTPPNTDMLASHTYSTHGIYDVSLNIIDPVSTCSETKIESQYIEIQEAIADFTVSPTSTTCPPLHPVIVNNGDPELYNTEYTWNSGDDAPSHEFQPDYIYNHAGEYILHLTAETGLGCTAEAEQLLTVNGPSGDYTVSSNQICLHEEVNFEVINGDGIDNVSWTFGDGGSANGNTASHIYDVMPSSGNSFHTVLTLYGGECEVPYDIYISVYDVHAAFSMIDVNTSTPVDGIGCSPFEVSLIDISSGENLSYDWTIEGLGSYNIPDIEDAIFENTTQQDSVIEINLSVENSIVGCADDTTMQLVVGYIPDPKISPDTIICQNDSFFLYSEGGSEYLWYPGLYLSATDIACPEVTPEESMTYYLTVTGENGCANSDSMHVGIQLPVITSLSNISDTIIIGENTSVLVTTNQENANILWTPDDAISCVDCDNPLFDPLESTEYYLSVSDSLGCFTEDFIINIIVEMSYTLDVPSAFTPQGSEVNRVVFVRGQGIKQLREFSIYNRWGEKLFTTDDINRGWDGYYQGKLQPIDSYVYFVDAKMWDGTTRTKKGTILLMQ